MISPYLQRPLRSLKEVEARRAGFMPSDQTRQASSVGTSTDDLEPSEALDQMVVPLAVER